MSCDFIYASTKARFGQPEINLGILPGFGGTQRLSRIVGKSMAKEMILTGDIITAEEALRIGLVNKVVDPDKLMDEALAAARKIASKGAIAVRACKNCINHGLNTDLSNGLFMERQAFGLLCSTEDQREGMKAFLDKRKPEFKDK
jgi:enoyl-CoA hydratase